MNRRKFVKDLVNSSLVLAISPGIFLGNKSLEAKIFPAYEEVFFRYNLKDNEKILLVDGENQKMYLTNGLEVSKEYIVSTAKAGFGHQSGSFKTPTGIHRIKEKIGSEAPIGTIFYSTQNSGKVAKIYTEKFDSPNDLVLSRIMWLEGCEEKNKNTHSRYIYIHGTPEEGLIGTPVSHGCIRMKNKDVIELYDLVKSGTYVNIKEKLI